MICVELEAGEECLDQFELETWKQEDGNFTKDKVRIGVEYQWKPLKCSHCKVYGHEIQKCFQKNLDEAAAQVAKERGSQFPSWTEIKFGQKKAMESDTSTKGKQIIFSTLEERNKTNSCYIEAEDIAEINSLAVVALEKPQQDLMEGCSCLLAR